MIRTGDTFARELHRVGSARHNSLSLISPCCQARTDVPRTTIEWHIRTGNHLPVWCGRRLSARHRSRGSQGCDWCWTVTFEITNGIITATWKA